MQRTNRPGPSPTAKTPTGHGKEAIRAMIRTRPRRKRSAYFWLMFWLYALLAFGLCLLALGVAFGRPVIPFPSVMPA